MTIYFTLYVKTYANMHQTYQRGYSPLDFSNWNLMLHRWLQQKASFAKPNGYSGHIFVGNRRVVRPNQNIEINHNATLNSSLSIVLTIHIDIKYHGFTHNHVGLFLPFFLTEFSR